MVNGMKEVAMRRRCSLLFHGLLAVRVTRFCRHDDAMAQVIARCPPAHSSARAAHATLPRRQRREYSSATRVAPRCAYMPMRAAYGSSALFAAYAPCRLLLSLCRAVCTCECHRLCVYVCEPSLPPPFPPLSSSPSSLLLPPSLHMLRGEAEE